jgi:hypothetical protein
MAIPEDPDRLLTRDQGAEALTEAGYPTSASTLSAVIRRGGPPYKLYGRVALYRWQDLLTWAKSKLREPTI